MIFNVKILTNDPYCILAGEVKALMLIADLHLQGKITDVKMKGMVSSLRQGKLLRYVENYHAKGLNGKWYNGYDFLNVLEEIHNEMCNDRIMSLDEFLKYLNLLLNKNKNFCIDYVYNSIVKPLIERIGYNYSAQQMLESLNVEFEYMSYYEADRRNLLSDGYCCEDCDGDLHYYKQSQYEHYYKNQNVNSYFKKHLRSFKTHLKNPNDILA